MMMTDHVFIVLLGLLVFITALLAMTIVVEAVIEIRKRIKRKPTLQDLARRGK